MNVKMKFATRGKTPEFGEYIRRVHVVNNSDNEATVFFSIFDGYECEGEDQVYLLKKYNKEIVQSVKHLIEKGHAFVQENVETSLLIKENSQWEVVSGSYYVRDGMSYKMCYLVKTNSF